MRYMNNQPDVEWFNLLQNIVVNPGHGSKESLHGMTSSADQKV